MSVERSNNIQCLLRGLRLTVEGFFEASAYVYPTGSMHNLLFVLI
jgi:hypothetical protein